MGRLDHVALWSGDRNAAAKRLADRLGMHVIERTDRFTLVGWDARLGKLTLFASEPPRQRGRLSRIVLSAPGGVSTFELESGVLVETRGGPEDLVGVVLAADDPDVSARAWQSLGVGSVTEPGVVDLGDQFLQLVGEPSGESDAPLLNHLAVLVDSLDAVVAAVEAQDEREIERVEAENTRAAFVTGPDGVRLEYVEHRPTFALR